MNDPHVAALIYRLTVPKSLEFQDPPDKEIDTPEFTGRLSKGLLTLEPREHFETESQVKPMADAYVLSTMPPRLQESPWPPIPATTDPHHDCATE